ncbi:excalibur calcium-binding domain-containing protein [Brevundimonas sp. 2R-24]|uniref:Excalibur calcium-binding domain-containing protein n=1 Tax=Peiella sedimenti TaxID=3061083 RepID=A0ABT8SM20_9CAUL|nr:excalibur calcium-binding domain-containing protein [Caulobacteraceae bacterium XZ-24]
MPVEPWRDHDAAEARLRRLNRRFASASRRAERRGPLRLSEAVIIGALAIAAMAWARPEAAADAVHRLAKINRQLVWYPNCASAHAGGVYSIREGEPGYRPRLDADTDGLACEPPPR